MKKQVLITAIATVFIVVSSLSIGIIIGKNSTDKQIDLINVEDTNQLATTENIVESETLNEELLETNTLSNSLVYIGIDRPIQIFKTAPLPEKYMSNITCGQGLRNAISATDAGGKEVEAGFHNAWDIACPEGTKVYAMKEGYVKEVWPSYYNGPYAFTGHPSYGGYIEIIHPDHTISRYAHLSYTDVLQGAYVTEGQIIGLSGGKKGKRGSGKSTGPHLHIETILDMNFFTNFTNFIK